MQPDVIIKTNNREIANVTVINGMDFVDYPLVKHPFSLRRNAEFILRTLEREYPSQKFCFVGIGTSGAMMLTAIATAEGGQDHVYDILKKPGECSHRSTNYQFIDDENNLPIVVVDDVVLTGSTMQNIRNALAATVYGDQSKRVTTVAYSTGDWTMIPEIFPSVKLIIKK